MPWLLARRDLGSRRHFEPDRSNVSGARSGALRLVLIDYKGGAAFRDLTGLPH